MLRRRPRKIETNERLRKHEGWPKMLLWVAPIADVPDELVDCAAEDGRATKTLSPAEFLGARALASAVSGGTPASVLRSYRNATAGETIEQRIGGPHALGIVVGCGQPNPQSS